MSAAAVLRACLMRKTPQVITTHVKAKVEE